MGRIPEFLTFLSVALLGSCFCISFSRSVLVIPDFFIPFCEKLDRSWTAAGPQLDRRSRPGFSLASSRLLVFLAPGDEVDSGYLQFIKTEVAFRKTRL